MQTYLKWPIVADVQIEQLWCRLQCTVWKIQQIVGMHMQHPQVVPWHVIWQTCYVVAAQPELFHATHLSCAAWKIGELAANQDQSGQLDQSGQVIQQVRPKVVALQIKGPQVRGTSQELWRDLKEVDTEHNGCQL